MYFWDKHKTITSYYELLSSRICDRYWVNTDGIRYTYVPT